MVDSGGGGPRAISTETVEETYPRWFTEFVSEVRPAGFRTLLRNLEDKEKNLLREFFIEFRRGRELEKEKRWIEARDLYEGLAMEYPIFSDIAVEKDSRIVDEFINRSIDKYNQGVRALKAKKYSQAINLFTLALQVDPFLDKARYNLALAHKFQFLSDPARNKFSRIFAIEILEELLEHEPDNERARAQMALMEGL